MTTLTAQVPYTAGYLVKSQLSPRSPIGGASDLGVLYKGTEVSVYINFICFDDNALLPRVLSTTTISHHPDDSLGPTSVFGIPERIVGGGAIGWWGCELG